MLLFRPKIPAFQAVFVPFTTTLNFRTKRNNSTSCIIIVDISVLSNTFHASSLRSCLFHQLPREGPMLLNTRAFDTSISLKVPQAQYFKGIAALIHPFMCQRRDDIMHFLVLKISSSKYSASSDTIWPELLPDFSNI